VGAGGQHLAQLGRAEAVGPAEGDAVGQPGHVEVLRVHLELGVGHVGRLGQAQSFSWGAGGEETVEGGREKDVDQPI